MAADVSVPTYSIARLQVNRSLQLQRPTISSRVKPIQPFRVRRLALSITKGSRYACDTTQSYPLIRLDRLQSIDISQKPQSSQVHSAEI